MRSRNGDILQVDNEGTIQSGNQTTKTEERATIGTGIGAIIGAIAGGGKGAAIGALLGAGGGAGSVYAQGSSSYRTYEPITVLDKGAFRSLRKG